jgi:hypothetical protein
LRQARQPLHSIRALRRSVRAKGDASGGIWCDRRLAAADSGQEHYSLNNPSVTVGGCHRHQRLLQYLFCSPFYRPFRHLLGCGRHRAPILVILFTFFAGRLVSNGRGLSLILCLSRVPYAPTHGPNLAPSWTETVDICGFCIYPFTAALNLMRTPVLFARLATLSLRFPYGLTRKVPQPTRHGSRDHSKQYSDFVMGVSMVRGKHIAVCGEVKPQRCEHANACTGGLLF